MRRALLVAAAAVILAAAAYLVLVRDTTVTPRLVAAGPVAAIGSGEDAVGVAADGTVLVDWPPPEEGSVPTVSLGTPPPGPRVKGPVLEQVKILAAVPPALGPYVESSHYGDSGVDVVLDSGIELGFGTAGGASRKWRAAAAILASPEVTAVDYIGLQAPGRASIRGSGHTLPPIP